MKFQALVKPMIEAALKAGAVIMDFYRQDFAVHEKADHSPVTAADIKAEAIILDCLQRAAPDIEIIAEERMANGFNPTPLGQQFFLVDPLDGTREFIQHNGEFTVNIALVVQSVAVLGVIFHPVSGRIYYTDGQNSFSAISRDCTALTEIQTMHVCDGLDKRFAVSSRSHCSDQTMRWLHRNGFDQQLVKVGSSLKFCMLAEGRAFIYPRFERCMEWDTAAGDALLRAAGGAVCGLDGKPLLYGKRHRAGLADFTQDYFIALGAKADSLMPEWLHR
ncbi:3'(2'),5'-bisphosphate nucleotidase CysQ [Bartonella sp. LJL80]